jgi:hypothetical protein
LLHLKLPSKPIGPLVELRVGYYTPAENERWLCPRFLGLLLEQLVDANVARTRILLGLLHMPAV